MKTRPIPMIKPFWVDIAHAMVEYVRSGRYGRKPVLWATPDDERLEYDSEDEAIGAILDEMGGPRPDWPETITICGFARMEINIVRLHPLEDCLDALDEEYGNPEEPTEPTTAMKEAERVFLETIKKEYMPWMCEEVCRKEINIREWINAHPDWLDCS